MADAPDDRAPTATDASPPRVRAVVLNWNQHAATLRAVDELRRSVDVAVDVLVVDGSSDPDDVAALRRALDPDRLLVLPENRGYAGGMNAGLRFWRERGGDEPVLLLTPDARVAPDALRTLRDTLASDPRTAAVGPVVVYRESPRRIGAGGRILPRRVRVKLSPDVRHTHPYPVDWIEGCCMLLRPEAAAEVGMLDERYFLYFEEIDLCERLRRAGWMVVVAPDATVAHPKEPGTQPAHYFYYMNRNAYLFWKKNFGIPAALAGLEIARATVEGVALVFVALLRPGRPPGPAGRLRDLGLHMRGAVAGTVDHLRGRYGARGEKPDTDTPDGHGHGCGTA